MEGLAVMLKCDVMHSGLGRSIMLCSSVSIIE